MKVTPKTKTKSRVAETIANNTKKRNVNLQIRMKEIGQLSKLRNYN